MEFKKHAMILAVIDGLKEHGSWTGKTHVQKTLSLLHDKGEIEVPFEFVLYRHGPYSFDVQAELEQMRSYTAIEIEVQGQGYGVVLRRGPMAIYADRMGELSPNEKQAIAKVCRFVGNKGVKDLEKLATASWIRRWEGKTDPQAVAKRLHELKPHIPEAAALLADNEIQGWLGVTA